MKDKPMKSSGGNGKLPTEKGEMERTKKVKTVRSAAGMMEYNVTPKKGPGEF